MASKDKSKLKTLRRVVTEGLRVQRGAPNTIAYVDVTGALDNVSARQNHVIFARRGCGKTLLLRESRKHIGADVEIVYLNCEDFKKHSFPNVLLEILDQLFAALGKRYSGILGYLRSFYGNRRKVRLDVKRTRAQLKALKGQDDSSEMNMRESRKESTTDTSGLAAKAKAAGSSVSAEVGRTKDESVEVEAKYTKTKSKLVELDKILPSLKETINEYLASHETYKFMYLQMDDFYHLRRADQPHVMDYIHRLCKDTPVYFKVATLGHASVLYMEREGQHIGAQHRHDYQPVEIDFTFINLPRTVEHNKRILVEFGKMANMNEEEIDGLFMGEGFERLVLAAGGVPRDLLSLLMGLLELQIEGKEVQRIGKDAVRDLSRRNLETRINELKTDAEGPDQERLIRGVHALREFCLGAKTNIFLVPDTLMQTNEPFRDLINKLLDYRIVHSAASSITHKSQSGTGTYQAFAIDIGCYANLRKLDGRLNEIDLLSKDAKDQMRSMPILDDRKLEEMIKHAPKDAEGQLLRGDDA